MRLPLTANRVLMVALALAILSATIVIVLCQRRLEQSASNAEPPQTAHVRPGASSRSNASVRLAADSIEGRVYAVLEKPYCSEGPRLRSDIELRAELQEIGPQCLPFLLKVLEDPNPDLCEKARIGLESFGAHSLPFLATGLDNPRTRLSALVVLRRLGPQALPLSAKVAVALGDHAIGKEIPYQAAYTLAAMGPEVVPLLIQKLQSKDIVVKGCSAVAAGKLREQAAPAVPWLIAIAEDPYGACQQEAIRALGEIGPLADSSRFVLLAAMTDELKWVRRDAAVAFLGIGLEPEPAVKTLSELLKDPDPRFRLDVIQRLGFLGRRAIPAIDLVASSLRDGDPSVRSEAAEALGDIGPAAASVSLKHLREVLHDPDSRVRESCSGAIRRLERPHPLAGEPGQIFR